MGCVVSGMQLRMIASVRNLSIATVTLSRKTPSYKVELQYLALSEQADLEVWWLQEEQGSFGEALKYRN
jgi:hypothetical protein